jgi:hypothetical protein
MQITVFGGRGDSIKVYADKTVIFSDPHAAPDDHFNISGLVSIPRKKGKMELTVERGGIIVETFHIKPTRIGAPYIFLTSSGGATIADGCKLSPLM